MASSSTPLSDFPPELLEQIANTLGEMYPPVEVRSAADLTDHFETGRRVGHRDIAETFRVAADKARQKET